MTHIVAPANRASPLTRLTAAGLLVVWASLLLSPAPPPAGAQGTEADVLIAQAVLAYEDKHYDEALSLLRDALAIDPNNVEILYYIGLVQIATRNFGPATEVLEEALAKSPTDLAIKFQLGVAYFSMEQYDKAEPLLTEVFKVQPQKENVGYYVGFMRYRRKDYQGALEAFRAGASPDLSIQQLTKFYSGLTLGILGLPEQGASELEEASRIRTTSPLTGPADRLRDTMVAARDQQGRLHGEVRFGAFYDTNVRTNPPSTSDPTANAIRSTKTNSPGQLAAVRFEYA
jgi:tetratricopeptide (TPR) repeat protein